MSNTVNFNDSKCLFNTLKVLLKTEFFFENDQQFREAIAKICPNDEEFLLGNKPILSNCFFAFWVNTYPHTPLMCIKKHIISANVGEEPEYEFYPETLCGNGSNPKYCIIATFYDISSDDVYYNSI